MYMVGGKCHFKEEEPRVPDDDRCLGASFTAHQTYDRMYLYDVMSMEEMDKHIDVLRTILKCAVVNNEKDLICMADFENDMDTVESCLLMGKRYRRRRYGFSVKDLGSEKVQDIPEKQYVSKRESRSEKAPDIIL